MAKPRVTTNCVADKYAAPTEKIVEVISPDSDQGGLIAFRATDRGLVIDLYRMDAGIIVNVEGQSIVTKGASEPPQPTKE